MKQQKQGTPPTSFITDVPATQEHAARKATWCSMFLMFLISSITLAAGGHPTEQH
jgi:hypothetical protein